MLEPVLLKRLPQLKSGRPFPWLLAVVLAAGLLATIGLQPAVIVAESAHVSVHEVQVVPAIAGLVTEVAVAPGEHVDRGQLLAKIDDAEAQARLQSAEARLALAAGPEKTAAAADCTLAKLDLAAREIRAPHEGTIARCSLEPGDYAPAGTAIATIVTSKAPWIAARVNERDATVLHVGATAHVSLPAFPGRSWTGKVSRIGRVAERKKGEATLPVRITLDGLPADVLPGMSAAVGIER
ncbi:MAG TPA: efflux RND transporter periplasmic adaptor subunit [Oscillatoriaceae cyanobacterium]